MEDLVAPLQESKSLKKADGPWSPDQLNELGMQGWEAIGLSLEYGDFIAWRVVLLEASAGQAYAWLRIAARLPRSSSGREDLAERR